jgi:hypothetical protein
MHWTLESTAFSAFPVRRDGSRTAPIRFELLAPSPAAALTARDPQPGAIHYISGSASTSGSIEARHFAEVLYDGVWPSVDLRFYVRDGDLEYDVLTEEIAGLEQVRVRAVGATRLTVGRGGELVAHSDEGELRQSVPHAYVVSDSGERSPVRCWFKVFDEFTYGFAVDAPAGAGRLVVDPGLTYCTYYGGTGADQATCSAIDAAGNIYVGGHTMSPDLNVTTGASYAGGRDFFVMKLEPNGCSNALIYATYVAVGDADLLRGIAVDSSANVYLTGQTQGGFPITTPSWDPTFNGTTDCFVAKLSPSGGSLLFSTYLGGQSAVNWNGTETGYALAVDASGLRVYVAGATSSPSFPTTTCAAQPGISGSGGADGFLSVFLSDGSALLYSTFLGDLGGGSVSQEELNDVIVDGPSNVFVGGTASSGAAGSQQWVVARFDTLVCGAGSLAFTRSIGGSSDDRATALALDTSGDVFVAGVTSSGDFPVTGGAFDATYSGSDDLVLMKLRRSDGSTLYSTYFGGSAAETPPEGIAADSSGCYLVGRTSSSDLPLTSGAHDRVLGGAGDGFLACLRAAGGGLSDLVYSSYFGGAQADSATEVEVQAAAGIPFVVGSTDSTDLPATAGALATTSSGSTEVFVAGFSVPYCTANPNSASAIGAGIAFVGSPKLSDNCLSLETWGCPANKPGIFFHGALQTQVPFGAGVLCIAGSSMRLPVLTTSAQGEASQVLSASAFQPGTARNFQFWFRDPVTIGPSFNLSNAVQVRFTP